VCLVGPITKTRHHSPSTHHQDPGTTVVHSAAALSCTLRCGCWLVVGGCWLLFVVDADVLLLP